MQKVWSNSFMKTSIKKKMTVGIDAKLVRYISKSKGEPEWMLKKRLEGLKLYEKTPIPAWGPALDGLDLENTSYYIDPKVAEKSSWKDLPENVINTFDKL